MEELAVNLTQDEVNELIKHFPLLPSRNRMIVTVNTEEEDLDLEGAGLAQTQYVIATGPHVWDEVVPGCRVLLDLDKMAVQTGPDTYEIKVDPVKVGDRIYAFVHDTNVKSIDNR